MVIDINKLKNYLDEGLLISQKHPSFDLHVWNYSKNTQFEKKWDDITLACRGLVTDGDGNIVSMCIPKFFNLEEIDGNLPSIDFDVYMKYDGSYISLFYYDGSWIFSSRGSFTSDQVRMAKKIFDDKYSYDLLDKEYNYIFELIGPSNRIVLNYKMDALILLTSYKTDTCEEQDIYTNDRYFWFYLANKYIGFSDYKTLKNLIPDDEEGYVIRFKDGYRLKIKGEEYCKLHKQLSMISNIMIWEVLKNGDSLDDLIADLPDELFFWIKNVKNDLLDEYVRVENEYKTIFDNYKNIDTKKEFALSVSKIKNCSILFSMYDNKSYSENIWKIIKPKRITPSSGINN